MSIVSNKKTATNTVELEISVGAQELSEATGRVFKKRAKSIMVPGFRKGKAPRQIIEKMYGKDIFLDDAINELAPKAYQDAVDEAGIEPVDRADIELLSADVAEGFTFKATVTVKPEIELGEYKGLAAEKTVYTVSDEDVTSEIERMRERNARIITVEDRGAGLGDTATIDFEGFLDGVAFEGGKGESHQLELGSGSFIPGFESQILGHKPGEEFDVEVTFPEEYHAEDLAGKPAVFKVKLHEIKGKQLPELDDEFAKDVSEFDTLDELKADIRSKLQENRDSRADSELENKLMDQVLEGIKGEIPDVMFESKVDDMVRDFAYRLQSQGMKIEMYLQYTGMDMEAFRATFREQAERQVKMRLALEAIAAKENFAPTAEEIEAEYTKLAESYELKIEQVKGMLPEKDVTADLSCTKAIDLVRDSAKVTEVAEKKAEEDKPKKKASAKKADKAEDSAGEAEGEKPAKKPAAKKAAKAADAEEGEGEDKPAKKPAAKKAAAKKNEEPKDE